MASTSQYKLLRTLVRYSTITRVFFSIVFMAMCDANYCFTVIDVGNYGRQSDGGVFAASALGAALESGTLGLPEEKQLPNSTTTAPYMIVGDEAFPLKTYLMRPYPGAGLTKEKRIFNYRLSRARRIIENAFGILAARWRIFRRPIIAKPEKVDLIVKAACCLHNFLKISESAEPTQRRLYCPPSFADFEDSNGTIHPGEWRIVLQESLSDVGRSGSNTFSRSAGALRDKLSEYFITEAGSVPWQDARICEQVPLTKG